jgi:serine/threonine-protein kinase
MAQTIGRYEIKKELGRGGMATVFLAQDPRFRRSVAIKVLPRQFTHDPRFLARFEQEAQTIAALEDPAIVPVYDFGEEDDAPFIVMRYMTGGTLRERMVERPLTLAEIVHILERLAPALDKAHQLGIIHRDLKPDNVLFDGEKRPYLADFGIARMAEATHTMTVVGTPSYMSPEQVRGEQKLDWRSDLYALGVMLFEMLTGQQPYEAETPSGQMFKHAMEPVPDMLAINPDLAPQAQLVIERAMAKDREKRYQSAGEIVTAVRSLVAVEEAIGGGQLAAERLAQSLSAENTKLDTPSEPQSIPLPAGGQPARKATRRVEDKRRKERSGASKPPGWVWWGGAIVLLILLILAFRAIFNADSEPPVTTEMRQKDGMNMVYVPPGIFSMGSLNGQSDEQPPHAVSLLGFWIDQTEVTNSQFADFLNGVGNQEENGVTWIDLLDGDVKIEEQNGQFVAQPAFTDHPVIEVSWYGAAAYCTWVGGRLPSEAQWEYAARGPENLNYPWGEEFDGEKANYCDQNCSQDWSDISSNDGFAQTAPVGSYPDGASWSGALDMAGNVWEWVNDWYDPSYYENSPQTNPMGPENGSTKVLRGGAWNIGSINLRGANRNTYAPAGQVDSFGFRCMIPGE